MVYYIQTRLYTYIFVRVLNMVVVFFFFFFLGFLYLMYYEEKWETNKKNFMWVKHTKNKKRERKSCCIAGVFLFIFGVVAQ